jgi:hypothetical protein
VRRAALVLVALALAGCGGQTAEGGSDGLAELEVPAGRFVLGSWQRTCDGNCGYLDAPADRCLIVVRPGKGCTIDVG